MLSGPVSISKKESLHSSSQFIQQQSAREIHRREFDNDGAITEKSFFVTANQPASGASVGNLKGWEGSNGCS